MKLNYEKAVELKVNVDDQQVDMKHLKEQCDNVTRYQTFAMKNLVE